MPRIGCRGSEESGGMPEKKDRFRSFQVRRGCNKPLEKIRLIFGQPRAQTEGCGHHGVKGKRGLEAVERYRRRDNRRRDSEIRPPPC